MRSRFLLLFFLLIGSAFADDPLLLTGDDASVREVLASRPDRGRLALHALADSRTSHYDLLVETALAAYPGDPVVLAITASYWANDRLEAFAPSLARVLRDDDGGVARTVFISQYLDALLALGRAEEAIEVWDGLAPEVRQQLLAGGDVRFTFDGIEFERSLEDIRRELAAAHALTGRKDEALQLVRDENPDHPVVALLHRYIERPATDPFGLVMAFMDLHLKNRQYLVWQCVLLDVGTRHGYGRVVRWIFREALMFFPSEEFESRLRVEEGAAPPDAIAAHITRVLAAKPLIANREKPMPANLGPAAAGEERPEFPNARTFRVHRSGNEVVAVTATYQGFFAVRSHDGGSTWDAPIFLGLHASTPYELVENSALPLIDGDHLRIEVKGGVYLDFTFAELTRDTDEDGLSDVAEEQLLTDPRDEDTDGDAIPDGTDMLPLVAFGAGSRDESEILRMVLGEMYSARFIEASRDDFHHATSEKPLIVLTAEEIERAEKKLGPIYGTRIAPVLINRNRTKAFILWDSGSSGGTCILERRDGIWVKIKVSSWIS